MYCRKFGEPLLIRRHILKAKTEAGRGAAWAKEGGQTMKKGKLVHMFAGCGTPQGYVSYAEDDLAALERVFVLLGAPGCGKSGLIARVAENFCERGFDVELWQGTDLSGGAEGVVIPELAAAVVDAGFRQYIRPQNPGVVEEIYNLGDCWEQAELAAHRGEIKRLGHELRRSLQREAGLLALYQQGREKVYAASGIRLSEREVDDICAKLAKEIFAARHIQIRRFFAEAMTADGLKSCAQEISACCRRRYLLSGDAAPVLERLAERAAEHGHSVDIYYSFLAPERPVMLLLPGLSAALLDASLAELEPLYQDEIVRLAPAEQTERLAEALEGGELPEARLAAEQAAGQAAETQKELASYYTAAMDFAKVAELGSRIMRELWQMAAERGF